MSHKSSPGLVAPPRPAVVNPGGWPRRSIDPPSPDSRPTPAGEPAWCLQSTRLTLLLAEPLRLELTRREELARLAALAPRAASD